MKATVYRLQVFEGVTDFMHDGKKSIIEIHFPEKLRVHEIFYPFGFAFCF